MTQQTTPAAPADQPSDRPAPADPVIDSFSIDLHSTDGYPVVEVCGELDIATSPELREVVQSLLAGGQVRIILDLSRVSFLDSTALGVLVGAHNKTAAGHGALALVSPGKRALRTLEITGLTRVLNLQPSLVAAATTLSG